MSRYNPNPNPRSLFGVSSTLGRREHTGFARCNTHVPRKKMYKLVAVSEPPVLILELALNLKPNPNITFCVEVD